MNVYIYIWILFLCYFNIFDNTSAKNTRYSDCRFFELSVLIQSGQREFRVTKISPTLIDFAPPFLLLLIISSTSQRNDSIFAYLRDVQMKRTKSPFLFFPLFFSSIFSFHSFERSETRTNHSSYQSLPLLRFLAHTSAHSFNTYCTRAHHAHASQGNDFPDTKRIFRSRVDAKKRIHLVNYS